MKKIIAGLWVAALAATSCTQTDLVDNPQNSGYIEYELYAQRPTRATVIDNTNFTSFKVYAYQNIFRNGFSAYYNETVSRADATKPWAGEKPRKWPTNEDDYLDFYALSGNEPSADYNFQYTPATSSTRADFTYEVPAAPDKQKDLLVATKFGAKNSTTLGKLSLSFKHALTQIAFKAKSISADYKMQVTKIELKQIPSAGRFTYDETAQCGLWSEQATPADYTFTPNNGANEFATHDATLALTAQFGNLMLLPNGDIGQKAMEVSYTVFKTADANDPGTPLKKTILLGAHENAGAGVKQWLQGTRLTYALTLTGTERAISFSTTVDPWETNEQGEDMDAGNMVSITTIENDGGGLETRDNVPYPFTINAGNISTGYTIESNEPWVTISDQADGSNAKQTLSYDGTGTITRAYEKTKTWYAVLAMNNTGADRVANITVKRGPNAPEIITVKQKKFVSWDTENTNETLSIPGEAGAYAIHVKRGLTHTISITPADAGMKMSWDWANYGGGATTSLETGNDNKAYRKLYILVDNNPSTSAQRQFQITSNRFPYAFTITQNVGPAPKWKLIDKNGVKLNWANGYLVRKSGSTTECEIGHDWAPGLYFYFGSLIGWSPASNPDGTGNAVDDDVIWSVKPASYTATPTTFPGTRFDLNNISPEDGTLPLTIDASTGIGDPCRHYLGGKWRMPTSAEMRANILNGVANGSSFADAGFSRDADVNHSDVRFARSGFGHASANGRVQDTDQATYVWTSDYVAKQPLALLLKANDTVAIDESVGGMPIRCVSDPD